MKTFNELCEAYEVLSDGKLKFAYDRHRHEGIKDTGSKQDGRFQIGYSYSGRCFEIYENFFGNQSPYTNNYEKEV